MKIRVLSAAIYEPYYGNCSNNGISTCYKEILIPCEDGPIEIDDNNLPDNYCTMEVFEFGGRKSVHFTPYNLAKSGKWTMFGGTFAFSSDARFARCTKGFGCQPIQIHDRVE